MNWKKNPNSVKHRHSLRVLWTVWLLLRHDEQNVKLQQSELLPKRQLQEAQLL